MKVNQREHNVFESICNQVAVSQYALTEVIAADTGLEMAQVKGYVRSLKGKGLIDSNTEKLGNKTYTHLWPTSLPNSFVYDDFNEEEWDKLWRSRVHLRANTMQSKSDKIARG